MPEVKTELSTFQVTLKCSKCDGLIECTGKGITRWETEWEHICKHCGEIFWYSKCYPHFEYEVKEQLKNQIND